MRPPLPYGVAALFLRDLHGITPQRDAGEFDLALRQLEAHWSAGGTARSFRYRPPDMDARAMLRALERKRQPP